MTASVFDPAQQQRRAILKKGCARVEHSMSRIWPVGSGQDRICGVAVEKFLVGICCGQWSLTFIKNMFSQAQFKQ